MLTVKQVSEKYGVTMRRAAKIVSGLAWTTDPTRKLVGKPPRLYEEADVAEKWANSPKGVLEC